MGQTAKRAGCALLLGLLLWPVTVRAEAKRYALVVGIREYPVSRSLTPLEFTEPDANEIAATLRERGFEVTLMTQSNAAGENNQRFNPSAALIRKQFADLVKTPGLGKDDSLMLVLGGHGIQLPSRRNPKAVTFYFCPADASLEEVQHAEDVRPRHNLLPVQELYDTLQKSPAGVKLLVVDACRNNPNKPSVFRSANSVTRPPIPTPPGGTAALFSCSASEQAAEDPELKHGVFSHFLIEALQGKADLNSDRLIDLTELYAYVGNRTFTHVRQKYSQQQMPEFKGEITGWAPLLALPSHPFDGSKAGEAWAKNSLKMPFRWCPPGQFMMGNPLAERPQNEDEKEVRVTLSHGFWMGQHEVTQGQWVQVMGGAPWKGQPYVQEQPENPASYILWNDARAFCGKLTSLGHQEGWLPKDWRIDLPTEAQWEYACRAGTTTQSYFGDDPAVLDDYVWYDKNAWFTSEQHPRAVGGKKPNAWNLYDMHGNVREWCRDWYHPTLPGGLDPEVKEPGESRCIRGGSVFDPGRRFRSAVRASLGKAADTRHFSHGFRVVAVQSY